jgi:hypothetical protein
MKTSRYRMKKKYNNLFNVRLSGTTMIGSIKDNFNTLENVIQVYDKKSNDWTLTASLYAESDVNVMYDYYDSQWSEYKIYDDTIIVGYPYTTTSYYSYYADLSLLTSELIMGGVCQLIYIYLDLPQMHFWGIVYLYITML